MGSDQTRFWVVWDGHTAVSGIYITGAYGGGCGGGPQFTRHETRAAAEGEAQRQARLNAGQRYYVLEAQAAYEATGVVRTELLPF